MAPAWSGVLCVALLVWIALIGTSTKVSARGLPRALPPGVPFGDAAVWANVEYAIDVDGETAAAAISAAGVPDHDADALLRHAATLHPDPAAAAVWKAFAVAVGFTATKDDVAASVTLSALRPRAGSVLAVLVAGQKGEVRARLAMADRSLLREVGSDFEASARAAAEIGLRTEAAKRFVDAGRAADDRGASALAQGLFDRAYVLWIGLGERWKASVALQNAGNAAAALGDWLTAQAAFDRAMELSLEASAPGEAASAASARALVDVEIGAYARALTGFERALDLLARESPPQAWTEAETKDRMGLVYLQVGDPKSAVQLHHDAMSAHERARASFESRGLLDEARAEMIGVAMARANRAHAKALLDDTKGALEDLELSLKEFQGLRAPDMVALCMTALADVLSKSGAADRAIALQRGAIEALDAEGTDRQRAEAVGGLGEILARAADSRTGFQAALESFRGARAIAARAEALDLVASMDVFVSKTLLALGDDAGALASARGALDGIAALFAGLADPEVATARESRYEAVESGVAAALVAKDDAALSEFVERGRAGTLLAAVGSRNALLAALLPPDLSQAKIRAHEALSAARGALQAAIQRGAPRAEIGAATADVARAEDALTNRDAAIARSARTSVSWAYPKWATIEEIRSVLEPGEALVRYVVARGRVLALVDTRERSWTRELASDTKVDALLEQVKLADHSGDWKGAAKKMADAVWSPLALPVGVRRVFVSPDGPLLAAPFAVLDLSREIVLIPSGTVLRLVRAESLTRPPIDPMGPVLALGGVDYRAPRPQSALYLYGRGENLSNLDDTGGEATAIGTTVLVGPDATEAKLRATLSAGPPPSPTPGASRAARWAAVHFACHGLADLDRPMLTCLALGASGEDDGFLTVAEVLRMQVPADLVVLSACQTARSAAFRGEGVLGLPYAFLARGVPRVIASVWKVDDEATRTLMAEFHRARRGGSSIPAALRGAQALVRSIPRFQHPYYWASWQLWGVP